MGTSRREFLLALTLGAFLPLLARSEDVNSYDAGYTHNDIHDLEYAAELEARHVKFHFDSDTATLFKNLHQAAYDFHTFMHSKDESNHEKAKIALKPVTEAMIALQEFTDSKTAENCYRRLLLYYTNLFNGIHHQTECPVA